MRRIITTAVTGMMALAMAHAQGTVEWSAPVEGKASSIFFNAFTQTPVLETSKAYVGMDIENHKVAWTVNKSAKNEALKKVSKVSALTGSETDEAGAFVVEDYREIPFTQFAFIGNYIMDVYSGEVVIGGAGSEFKSLEKDNIIPELNCVLFKVKNEQNEIVLHSVDIETNKVLWTSKLANVNKAKAAFKMAMKVNGTEITTVDNFQPGLDFNGNIIYKHEKKLYQLDAKTGKIKWENECNPGLFFLDKSGKFIVSVENAGVLASGYASYGKTITCIDAASGTNKWQKPMKLDAAYKDHQFLNDKEIIITHENGLNLYNIETGKPVWKKGFKGAFTNDFQLTDEGIKVFFGNKIMMLNKATGEKAWKKPIKLDDMDEEATEQIEKVYKNTWALVTPKKIVVYDKATNERKWSERLSKSDKVAFDDKNGKILVVSGKKIYVMDPDNDAKAPKAIETKIKYPKEVAGYKVTENGYFIFGQKEFIMVDANKSILNHQIYSQLKSGRLINAALTASLVVSGAMSTTVTYSDGQGNETSSGLFCDLETAKRAGRAFDAQLKLKRELKANNKARVATRSNDDFSIFLKGEKVNGTDNLSLVIVNKNTGKEVKTVPFSNDRKVVYEIDFNGYRLYYVENGKLISMKL